MTVTHSICRHELLVTKQIGNSLSAFEVQVFTLSVSYSFQCSVPSLWRFNWLLKRRLQNIDFQLFSIMCSPNSQYELWKPIRNPDNGWDSLAWTTRTTPEGYAKRYHVRSQSLLQESWRLGPTASPAKVLSTHYFIKGAQPSL